jgi:hypothetical protein
MSEKQNAAQARKAAAEVRTSAARRSRLDRAAENLVVSILALPRLSRIALSVVFALMVILVVRPIIDVIYLDNFYVANPETNMLPTWVATGIGLIMYVAGWRLIVGIAGETLTVRRATLYYLFVGIGSALWVVALIVHGLITANAPD